MSAWEDLCDGCGSCCEIGNTGVACPFLNTMTNRCTVYEERQEKAPWCAQITPENTPRLHKHGILPSSCAYVLHQQGRPQLEPEDVPTARLIPYSLADKSIVEKHERLTA